MVSSGNQNENSDIKERILTGYIVWIETNIDNIRIYVPGLIEHIDNSKKPPIEGKQLKSYSL